MQNYVETKIKGGSERKREISIFDYELYVYSILTMLNVLLYRFKWEKNIDNEEEEEKKTHRATNLTAKACNLFSKVNSLPAAINSHSVHISNFIVFGSIGKLFFKRFAINEVCISINFKRKLVSPNQNEEKEHYLRCYSLAITPETASAAATT